MINELIVLQGLSLLIHPLSKNQFVIVFLIVILIILKLLKKCAQVRAFIFLSMLLFAELVLIL